MAKLSLSGLGKRYGGHQVFKDLNLEIKDGECFTLLGPSGCGKTVVLRLVAGFEQPSSGEISIGSNLVSSVKDDLRLPPEERRIGVVFQDYAVWPHMNVWENIVYPLQIQKIPKPEASRRVAEAIAQVGLDGLDERLPSQLSGGQQQRVALARALVCRPQVMLLDEPLCNLDANLREEMRFEIRRLQRETGLTILYVTHDQEIAMAISDRLGIMDSQGRLRQVGAPEQVFDQPEDSFVFGFMGVSNFLPASFEGSEVRLGDCSEKLDCAPPDWKNGPNRGYLACRPGDIDLLRQGGMARGKVIRRSLLGPYIDYRIEVAGKEVRVQQDTRLALERGLLLDEGEACGMVFHQYLWFKTLGETGEVRP